MALRGLLFLAFLVVVVELVPNLFGGYGYFIDELYYVACSERLSLGYVDHPPLAAWLLRGSRMVLGDSVIALRVLPALAGGVSVLLTGLLAWRLGAGRFGQLLAAFALAAAPIPLLFFGFFSMNPFELLFWVAGSCALVERARSGDGRWWIAVGVIAGLGLLNKHTFALFAVGLLVGVLLTDERRQLACRWLWGGVAVAALLVAPNLLWQAGHGWPSLEFYRNADAFKNVPTPPLEVLLQQLLFMNPAGVLVWGAGVAFFLAARRGQRWRFLGWAFVALLLLFVAGRKSRPDRLAGAYPMVFAAGAVLWEQVSARPRWGWVRVALPGLLGAFALVLAPLALPVLPPEALARYSAALGIVPQIERGDGKASALPQWMADRLEWPEFVEEIAQVTEQHVDPGDRDRALVLAPSYGHAGALELLGRDRGLPPVAGTQNTYHLWGPGDSPAEILISVGFGPDALGDLYEQVVRVSETRCRFCPPWRNGIPIYVARGPKRPFREAWQRFRHFE